MQKILENWLKRSKKDLDFEIKHKSYFIKHYLRILVLMALVFTAAYYISAKDVCTSLNGSVIQTDSFYKVSCGFEENTIYSVPNNYKTLDVAYKNENYKYK